MPSNKILTMVTACIDVVVNSTTYGLLTKTSMVHQFTRIGEHFMNDEFTKQEASDELLKVFADYPPEQEHRLNNIVKAEMLFDKYSTTPYTIYMSRSDDNGKTWTRESVRDFSTIEETDEYLLFKSNFEHMMLELEAQHAVHAS